MLTTVREDVTRMLANARFEAQPAAYAPPLPSFVTTHIDPLTGLNDAFGPVGTLPPSQLDIARSAAAAFADVDEATRSEWLATTSRNAACPCGSGKKFKHCHGAM
jgi:preprotein translocase subunit SecA